MSSYDIYNGLHPALVSEEDFKESAGNPTGPKTNSTGSGRISADESFFWFALLLDMR